MILITDSQYHHLIIGFAMYYLGFDLSTQQLKCLAIDEHLRIVHSEVVEFEKELAHYGTRKGVYAHDDVVDCPVGMWLEALDLVMKKFVNSGFDMGSVGAISGSCQQHGSVYWRTGAEDLLQGLTPSEDLVKQLYPNAFSRDTAPNWQDHSTKVQCGRMEARVGGPEELAQITGSRAHFRFTGPQIMKIAEHEPEAYADTESIALVSSFLTSVLCGKIVPLEEADACGMNLYDITARDFSEKLVEVVAPKENGAEGLLRRLGGKVVTCDEPVLMGPIAGYFVDKYGLNKNCKIFPFTGDNLATICSLPLEKNDVLVSLGTSTTVLVITDQYHPSPNYHLFIHPTIPKYYMGMICFSNGALAREKIRDAINGDDSNDWKKFNDAVLDDSLDNSNELGVYFPLGEIVPSVKAATKRIIFDKKTGEILEEKEAFDDPRHDAKNIVESQALSSKIRVAPLLNGNDSAKNTQTNSDPVVKFDYDSLRLSEYTNKRPNRVYFVGGASKNDAIVTLFAEVLGAVNGNYRLETPNSCALGGCFKAMWSDQYNSGKISKSTTFDKFLAENFPKEDLEAIHVDGDIEKKWASYNKKIVPLSNLESKLK